MNKKMREIRAQIEVLNEEAVKCYESKDLAGAESKLAEIEDLEREYKVAAKLFKTEKGTVDDTVVAQVKVNDKIKNFADSIRKIRNTMSEGTGTEGGYTVPDDIRTDIEKLREAKFNLSQLVSVEKVSTMSGKRTYKKRSSQTGFSKVGEGNTIGLKNTPQFDRLSYEIGKYAGILPVTNELLEDSDANIYNLLIEWIADESRVTRNKLIIEKIKEKAKTKLTSLDDIKKALNVTLGQAFKSTSKIVTNDDGLQYLDTLKDEEGKYLLQPNPSNPMKLVLAAGATSIPVEVVPNADLASENIYTVSTDATVQEGKTYYTRSGSEGSYVYTVVAEPTGNPSSLSYYEITASQIPVVIGDLKEGIKLFDRDLLNILASNTAAAGDLNAFEEDLTLYRAIEREDVQTRDADAFVNGYIEINTVATV